MAAQAAPPPPLPCTTSRPNLRPSYFRSTLWGGGRCASGFAAEMREAARADRDVVPSTPLHPPHTFPAPPHVHQRRRGYSQGMRPWNSARANSCSKAGAARALSSVESVETARPARRLIDHDASELITAPRRRLRVGPSRRRPTAPRSSKGGAAAAALTASGHCTSRPRPAPQPRSPAQFDNAGRQPSLPGRPCLTCPCQVRQPRFSPGRRPTVEAPAPLPHALPPRQLVKELPR